MAKERSQKYREEMTWGLVILLLGFAFLLHNLHLLRFDALIDHWPLAFVVMGIFKLAATRKLEKAGEGIWWIFFGTWLYVSLFEVFGFGFRESWPILVIGLGVSILWGGYLKQRRSSQPLEN